MHADAHRLREKWAAGEAVAGPFVQLPAPGVVEIFALAGFDFVVVDLEHGAFGIETAENMFRAAHGREMPAICRVLANSPALICAALNVGAAGNLVPHVDTAAEARAAVLAARFAPAGSRGLCPFVRSADYSAAKGPSYYAEASEAVIVGILLEGRSAYEQLDEILAIDGLDVVMVAPYDLSQSLGVPGEVDHPSVLEAFQDTCARAATSGKIVGIFSDGGPERHARWVRLGARMIGADVDSQLLWHTARAEVERFRATLAAAPA
jgi:4-hydroxy-2-oxoheptanedioate aldolase